MDSGGTKEAGIIWGAPRHHLANATELSMCGGDAAFLSDYFDHLFIMAILCSVYRPYEKVQCINAILAVCHMDNPASNNLTKKSI